MYNMIKVRRKVPIIYKVFNKDNMEFVEGYVQQDGDNIKYKADDGSWVRLSDDYVLLAIDYNYADGDGMRSYMSLSNESFNKYFMSHGITAYPKCDELFYAVQHTSENTELLCNIYKGFEVNEDGELIYKDALINTYHKIGVGSWYVYGLTFMGTLINDTVPNDVFWGIYYEVI